jgi:hypothetical protein
MPVAEHRPGYDEVFTVTEYYDGPRQGIATFRGRAHFYDCIFDEAKDDYSNLYRLTPVPLHIFDLAMEDWAIWERWKSAFHTGRTTLESHPALPQDRARHTEIQAVLDSALKTNKETCIIQDGLFEVLGSPTLPKGVIRPLQVKWTEP